MSQFYKVKYIRLPELLDELSLAKLAADGSYRKLIKKYTKVHVGVEQATLPRGVR